MSETVLKRELWLPRPRSEVFPFFANARNLQRLTPSWLVFEVLTPEPIEMRAGTLIDYRLRVHGLPLRWRTEIEVWEPPFRFVDRQLRGPYRLWHHTHEFHEQEGGTRCVDVVRYAARGGLLRPLIEALFVRRDVDRIFAFREESLRGLFGSSTPPEPART
ncbi:MAG: SRPBCC family protein [Verrucomicrobiales bacterium]|nr:SRPBCC family protein [Verrucomicrobiales bacterium]